MLNILDEHMNVRRYPVCAEVLLTPQHYHQLVIFATIPPISIPVDYGGNPPPKRERRQYMEGPVITETTAYGADGTKEHGLAFLVPIECDPVQEKSGPLGERQPSSIEDFMEIVARYDPIAADYGLVKVRPAEQEVLLPIDVSRSKNAMRSYIYRNIVDCIVGGKGATVIEIICFDDITRETYYEYVLSCTDSRRLLTFKMNVGRNRENSMDDKQLIEGQLWFKTSPKGSVILNIDAFVQQSENSTAQVSEYSFPNVAVIQSGNTFDIIIPPITLTGDIVTFHNKFISHVLYTSQEAVFHVDLMERYDINLHPKITRGLVRHLTRDLITEIIALLTRLAPP